MEFKTVRLLFEQSGTFRDVLKEIGFKAFDYDLDNQFNKVDYQIDLFLEIEKAYANKKSIFDTFDEHDLILAFFPCTYFSVQNELIWNRKLYQFKYWNEDQITTYIREREREREILSNLIEVHFGN